MPHFDYWDVVHNDLTEDLSIRLQWAQNACVRFIFDFKKYYHITPGFQNLAWIRLNDRRNLHSACLVHRLLSTSTPSYLASNFQYILSNHTFNTRSRSGSQLTFPTLRINLLDHSFIKNAIRNWNNLSINIRDVCGQSYQSFKTETYKHYLHNQNNYIS